MQTSFNAFADSARATPLAAAIILGSGTNVVADRVQPILTLPFNEITGLGAATVPGHRGRLTLGDWAGRRILVFEGRLHYYEGHAWTSVVRPVQIAHELGARVLLATNAAGGIHPRLGPGNLMAIRDHILWNTPRPWWQRGPDALDAPRHSSYSPRLMQGLTQAGQAMGLEMIQGVYASVTGPCYETPAEIRALAAWGADAVGMSTAREVDAAFALGMECAAVSCITNKAAGLSAGRLDHQDVLMVARGQAERLAGLMERMLALI